MTKCCSGEELHDAIELVHDQLEAFKYIGGFVPQRLNPQEFEESGEGVPISIVTLPDFVLDFNQDRLAENAPVCSVGGHAGRITAVLMHLLSDEDATHRVHFLTATGRLATRLLEDDFVNIDKEDSHDTYKRYCAPFVSIRPGQPRCAYLSSGGINPARAKEGDEINARDHIDAKPFVIDAIQAASAVYIGSCKTPDIAKILKSIWDNSHGLLFLDTRRVDKTSKDKLTTMLRTLNKLTSSQGSSCPQVILLVGEDEHDTVLECVSAIFPRAKDKFATMARRMEIRILHYTRSTVSLYTTFDGEKELSIEHKCGTLLCEQNSARFRAGIILAASVHARLDLVKKYDSIRNKGCTRKWGHIIHKHFKVRWRHAHGQWRGSVAYGLALASIDTDGECLSLGTHILGSLNSTAEIAIENNPIQTESANGPLRIRLDERNLTTFTQLAAARRGQVLANPLLPRCREDVCGDKCVLKDRRAAILFDLDGTLLDSSAQRGRGLQKALERLHEVDGLLSKKFRDTHKDPVSRQQFFEKEVYDRYPFFRWLVSVDFRQQWNRPEWYATYIVLAANQDIRKGIKKAEVSWQDITQSVRWTDKDKRDRKLQKLDETPSVKNFQKEIKNILRNRAVDLDTAIQAFSAVQMHPLKEARDLLTSLENTKAFNFYVVSEGDPETQWNKLCSIGLSDMFDRSHLLTTGDVAPKYDDERQQFEHEKSLLEICLRDVKQDKQVAKAARDNLGDIVSYVNTSKLYGVAPDTLTELAKKVQSEFRETQLKSEQRIEQDYDDIKQQKNVAQCVEKILAHLQGKFSVAFYAAVIRAIMRNPNRPLDTLQNLQAIRREVPDTPRMKFAMIGDRQTKDLSPPRELLMQSNPNQAGLITIRLLSGKYAVDDDENPDNKELGTPDYLALTLAHVKALMLSQVTWQRPCLVQEPPLFNWGISLDNPEVIPEDPEKNDEKIGVDHILRGMSMSKKDYRVISDICAAIMAEYLGRCAENERAIILKQLFREDDDSREPSEMAARVAALVRAGGLTLSWITCDEEIHFAEKLSEWRISSLNSAPSWVDEQLLNALYWIKNNARSKEAVKVAEGTI